MKSIGLRRLLPVAVVAALLLYIVHNWREFSDIRLEQPAYLSLSVAGNLLLFVIQGFISRLVCQNLGAKIGFWDSFCLGIATNFANFFLPMRGGLAARAIYLKKYYHLSYDRFLSSLMAYYVLVFFTTGICATVALGSIRLTGGSGVSDPLVLFAALGCLGSGLFFLLCPGLPKTIVQRYNVLKVLDQILLSWHGIKGNWRVVSTLLALAFVEVLASILLIWGNFGTLAINFAFVNLVAVGTLSNLGSLISITPSNLGIYEAILFFLTRALQIDAVQIVAASMIGRVVLVALLLILMPICSSKLAHQRLDRTL